MVNNNMYYVVGRTSCPYCVKAKDLLQEKSLNYKFRDLEENRELLMEFARKFSWDTGTMVFKFDTSGSPTFLGGYTDLVDHLDQKANAE